MAAFLNEATGKQYRATGAALIKGVTARLNEGFGLDDFKRVIEFKAGQWGADIKMSGYLRPETLFGSKFESYLNESGGPVGVPGVSTHEDEKKRAALDEIFNDD